MAQLLCNCNCVAKSVYYCNFVALQISQFFSLSGEQASASKRSLFASVL